MWKRPLAGSTLLPGLVLAGSALAGLVLAGSPRQVDRLEYQAPSISALRPHGPSQFVQNPVAMLSPGRMAARISQQAQVWAAGSFSRQGPGRGLGSESVRQFEPVAEWVAVRF